MEAAQPLASEAATYNNNIEAGGEFNVADDGQVFYELGKCRALVDFIGATEDELTFHAGDIISILDKSDSNIGWWEGYVEKTGQTGFFPFEGGWIEELPPSWPSNEALDGADARKGGNEDGHANHHAGSNDERTNSQDENSVNLNSEDEWASEDEISEQQLSPKSKPTSSNNAEVVIMTILQTVCYKEERD